MNIKIRNIDKNVVAKLDDLARKNHLSRNKFLIELLEKNSIVPQMEQLLKEYKQNQKWDFEIIKNIIRHMKSLKRLEKDIVRRSSYGRNEKNMVLVLQILFLLLEVFFIEILSRQLNE